MVDLYFHPTLARQFCDLTDLTLKRAYLDLFNEFERWLRELMKCVEMFASVGRNVEMTRLAEERIDERLKVLSERKTLYKS